MRGPGAWRASPVAVAPALVLAVVLAVGLAGCGGSGRGSTTGSPSSSTTASGSPSSSSTHTTRGSAAPAQAKAPRAVHGPPVGTRQQVHTHGADLTVTVTRVLTLTHTHTPALAGTRQVGVSLRIANQAGETYDSTSSGDVSVVLSVGQAEPLFVRAGACTTPLVDFESMIESGDVRSGCVAFSVPRRARIVGVRFSPHARTAGMLSWRVS
jgi:hypothetical protein